MDAADGSSSSSGDTQESKQESDVASDVQVDNTASSVMDVTQSTGCFSQFSQPAEGTSTTASDRRGFQLLPPGTSSSSVTITNTPTSSSVVVFSAPRLVTSSSQNVFRRTVHPSQNTLFQLTSPKKETSQKSFSSPFTNVSCVFSSSPRPSTTTAPKEFSFKPITTSASNIFSSVKNMSLSDTGAFKFNSYRPQSTEGKKDTFNWPLPSSSRSTNENVFGFRNTLGDAVKNPPKQTFNCTGHLSSHSNNGQPVKFLPLIKEDVTAYQHGRFQSITVMPHYSSRSFEEIRFDYYKAQQKIFVFRSSPFSWNTPYFFSSENKESKQLVQKFHKEVQTSSETQPDAVYAKGLFNEIWKVLECVVCWETAKPPIMQCETGHHVCNQCWSRLTVCPVCKRNKTTVRNFALETVFEKLPLPCKYHHEGCEAMVMAEDKEKHEAACDLRPFTCPIESCMQKVEQKDLMKHCVTNHGIRIAAECPLDNRSFLWSHRNVELTKYICIFNLSQWGKFLLCHKEVEDTSCIWLQLLHVNSKDAKFIYEIQICDKKDLQSVIYRGPVTRLSFDSEEVKHKCLRISSGLLLELRSAAFQMKLEIWKNNLVPT